VKITASAVIERGTKTNRVRVKRPKSPGHVRKRYRQDPAVRGMDSTVVAISLPIAELEALDAMCDRTQMARSHFIRQAVKHFGEKTGANAEQAKRWKEATR
jgi:hypothetical protein